MKKEILFQCVIPGRPGIKKNGKQIRRNWRTGQPFLSSSDKYLIWAKMAKAHVEAHNFKTPINVPVNLQCQFFFKNHQNEPDLDNCYAGIQDVLQSSHVIDDDKLVYSHDGSKKVFGVKTERVEVTITLADPPADESKGKH